MIGLLALTLLASPPTGGGPSSTLTLHQALTAARDAPGPQAARADADAADRAADAQWRRGRLPRLGVAAEYRRVHEPLEITTPAGLFQTEAGRVLAVGIEVTQPLFESGALLYAAPAARHDARAARHGAEHTRQARAYSAGLAWLGVRRVDAQVQATKAFVASLAERLRMLDALVSGGRGLEADRLKVALALDQARQDLRALGEQRRVMTLQLGRATGVEGAVDVRDDSALPTTKPPSQRPDLAVLTAQADAVAVRQDAVWGELLPDVTLNGRATYADTDLVADRTWFEAAIQLRWVPFAGGTRGPRAEALLAQARALRARHADARRTAAVDVAQAQSQLRIARGQIVVAETGITQASASLTLEQARYAEQRATMNDVLAAQARLRERRTRKAIAKLDAVQAELTLRWAQGGL